MAYSTFNKVKNDPLKEPMFFGQNVNVARYDQQRHAIFEKLIEKQLSFFWRPEEVDLSTDRKDFMAMAEHEQHIFLSNLKYQTLLDSVQGRSPNIAFLPVVSLPELEFLQIDRQIIFGIKYSIKLSSATSSSFTCCVVQTTAPQRMV